MTVAHLVPKRTFGNTGVKISKLCLGGGSFGNSDGQVLLDEALKHGVDCWEVVSFTGKVYGEYFKKHPDVREKIFLTGKVHFADPAAMEKQLDDMLAENETSVIDFLALHVLDNTDVLTNDIRKWVEKLKKEKKIRFFGFCTHKNMDRCLSSAADLGWIDGVHTVYSYRMQCVESMEDAFHKCYEKGVGIFAVKSMGLTVQRKTERQPDEEKLDAALSVHNITFEQAKLRSIWQNPALTSVCSLMSSPEIIQSNASAAMNETALSAEVQKLLSDYADGTSKYFCRRCDQCEAANADKVPIFDIMELLMYSRGYARMEMIAKKFMQIPVEVRNRMSRSDYSVAEKMCPQKMPIGLLMKEACNEFTTHS